MNERRWERIGAGAGILFVVLGVIAQFVPGRTPDQNASGQTLTTWIAEHHDRLMASMVLWSIASIFGLLFVATIRARLAEAEGGHSELATAAVVGGLFAFTLNWIGGVLSAMITFRPNLGVPASTVRAIWDAGSISGVLAGMGGAVLTGCLAAVVLTTGFLPRWVGWFAGLVTVGQVANLFTLLRSSGTLAPGGLFGLVTFLATLVLLLSVAVEFMVHAEAPATAGAAQGVAA
jgi:hypothetical protein